MIDDELETIAGKWRGRQVTVVDATAGTAREVTGELRGVQPGHAWSRLFIGNGEIRVPRHTVMSAEWTTLPPRRVVDGQPVERKELRILCRDGGSMTIREHETARAPA